MSEEASADPAARYRDLPAQVRPEDGVATVDVSTTDTEDDETREREWLLRNAAG
jgi:hypothetical protein